MSLLELKIAIFGFLFSIVSMWASLFLGVYHSKKCSMLPENIKHKISLTQGCLVEYHGQWIPIGTVRTDLYMK